MNNRYILHLCRQCLPILMALSLQIGWGSPAGARHESFRLQPSSKHKRLGDIDSSSLKQGVLGQNWLCSRQQLVAGISKMHDMRISPTIHQHDDHQYLISTGGTFLGMKLDSIDWIFRQDTFSGAVFHFAFESNHRSLQQYKRAERRLILGFGPPKHPEPWPDARSESEMIAVLLRQLKSTIWSNLVLHGRRGVCALFLSSKDNQHLRVVVSAGISE